LRLGPFTNSKKSFGGSTFITAGTIEDKPNFIHFSNNLTKRSLQIIKEEDEKEGEEDYDAMSKSFRTIGTFQIRASAPCERSVHADGGLGWARLAFNNA
jgi:hypothetical protein